MLEDKVELIEKAVSDASGIEPDLFYEKTRIREIVDARSIVWLLLRKELNLRVSHIGKRYGFDHSTVIFDTHRIKELSENDSNIRELYKKAKENWNHIMEEKAIDKDKIRKSGASLLINTWYIMIQAGYLLLSEAEKRLINGGYCLKKKQTTIYIDMMKHMEKIKELYDEFDDDFIQSLSNDYRQYDWIREDANEMNRLILLFADRCSPDADAKNRLFKFLRSLPEHGHAPDELVETFRMK